ITPDLPSADERGRLLEALSVTPMPVDELLADTGLSVPALQTLLIELDLAGRLEWSAGQLVALRG
ncbi:MAG: DNA-processing protein DprA, partial [Devosia sp.]